MPTKQFSRIYNAVAKQGVPYLLPQEWAWLPVDADCLLPGDPAVLWSALTEEFDDDDLLAAGVAERREGTLVLSPALLNADRGFIVLRRGKDTAFDIVTAAGCLSGAPPVLVMHRDEHTSRALSVPSGRFLYGVASMADAVLLRSLGVAAAPVALLAGLDLRCLERLLLLLGGVTEDDARPRYSPLPFDDEADPNLTRRSGGNGGFFSLVLLAGSVAAERAENPDSLVAVARHLHGAEKHLKFAWKRLSVWFPTTQDFAGLGYGRDLQSVEALQRCVWAPHAHHNLTNLAQGRRPLVRVPTAAAAYFELWTKRQAILQNVADVSDTTQRHAEVHQQYEAFVEKQFVRPLVEKALDSGAPEERMLLVEMASFSRLFHQVLPTASAARSQSARDYQGEAGRLFPRETFRQIRELGDILLKSIAHFKNLQKKGRRR